MIRVKVGMMDPLPSYWRNFIVHVHEHYWSQHNGTRPLTKNFIGSTSSARQIASVLLKPYGATISKFGKNEEIRFKNKHDLTFFVLKWS